jgi:hypothetical protein
MVSALMQLARYRFIVCGDLLFLDIDACDAGLAVCGADFACCGDSRTPVRPYQKMANDRRDQLGIPGHFLTPNQTGVCNGVSGCAPPAMADAMWGNVTCQGIWGGVLPLPQPIYIGQGNFPLEFRISAINASDCATERFLKAGTEEGEVLPFTGADAATSDGMCQTKVCIVKIGCVTFQVKLIGFRPNWYVGLEWLYHYRGAASAAPAFIKGAQDKAEAWWQQGGLNDRKAYGGLGDLGILPQIMKDRNVDTSDLVQRAAAVAPFIHGLSSRLGVIGSTRPVGPGKPGPRALRRDERQPFLHREDAVQGPPVRSPARQGPSRRADPLRDRDRLHLRSQHGSEEWRHRRLGEVRRHLHHRARVRPAAPELHAGEPLRAAVDVGVGADPERGSPTGDLRRMLRRPERRQGAAGAHPVGRRLGREEAQQQQLLRVRLDGAHVVPDDPGASDAPTTAG